MIPASVTDEVSPVQAGLADVFLISDVGYGGRTAEFVVVPVVIFAPIEA